MANKGLLDTKVHLEKYVHRVNKSLSKCWSAFYLLLYRTYSIYYNINNEYEQRRPRSDLWNAVGSFSDSFKRIAAATMHSGGDDFSSVL